MTSIKIGCSLPLSGAFKEFGQSASIAHKIWESDINKRGGLLGRQVELLCIDDQSDPKIVHGLYKNLIEVSKVDLVIGGYGTSLVMPTIPLIKEHKKFFISLMGKGANSENCFTMIPTGSGPNTNLSESFFKNLPKNSSVALIAADAEFSKNAILGARENAQKHRQRIVFEYNYSLATFDFTSLIQEIQELKPDAVFMVAYSSDALGLMKAINQMGYHPKKVGVSVLGQLGLKSMNTNVEELMEGYLAQTSSIEADILGYYLAPRAYAQLQILEQAVVATQSLVDNKLSGYTREALFETVCGEIKFNSSGECSAPQMVPVEFKKMITHDIEQTFI